MAEWREVCGPLLSRNPSPDPAIVAVDATRIETMDVNFHYFEHGGSTLDLRPVLNNVRCPTLVLLGEHDPLVPAHLAEEIAATVPSGLGRLEIVADAAHDLFTDNPAQTYAAIRRFISELA